MVFITGLINKYDMANQRRKGHDYERKICRQLKEMGYDAVTTRQESHSLDAAGVDILLRDAEYHVQCKSTSQTFNYPRFFEEYGEGLDKEIVVFHKRTKKAQTRFTSQGEYVIMKKKLFYELMEKLNGLK